MENVVDDACLRNDWSFGLCSYFQRVDGYNGLSNHCANRSGLFCKDVYEACWALGYMVDGVVLENIEVSSFEKISPVVHLFSGFPYFLLIGKHSNKFLHFAGTLPMLNNVCENLGFWIIEVIAFLKSLIIF